MLFYLAGIAYFSDGQYIKAINLLERITRECPLLSANGIWTIKAYYYLARAYEETGKLGDAKIKYQYLIDLWKNADPQTDWLMDARKRLLEIKQK